MKIKIYFILNIIIFLLFSCSNWKGLIKHNGVKDDARDNAILDYVNTHRNKEKVFYVWKCDDKTKKFYCFEISSRNHIVLRENTINSYSNFFPSVYKEINGKLFLWSDSTKVINKELVNLLFKYKATDSTYIKMQQGKLPLDSVTEIITDESKYSTYYFICKNNFRKYKKIKTQIILTNKNYPKIDCKWGNGTD